MYDGAFSESDFAATRAAGDVLYIYNVYNAEYEFTSLHPNVVYRWRVQTVKRGVEMPWSDWRNVELNDATNGISDVYGSPDVIGLSAMVSVYSISGVMLGRMPYASFVNNEAYVGVYIVKYGAKTFKIAKGGVY